MVFSHSFLGGAIALLSACPQRIFFACGNLNCTNYCNCVCFGIMPALIVVLHIIIVPCDRGFVIFNHNAE